MSLISESFSKKQIGRASSVGAIGAQVGAALAAILSGSDHSFVWLENALCHRCLAGLDGFCLFEEG